MIEDLLVDPSNGKAPLNFVFIDGIRSAVNSTGDIVGRLLNPADPWDFVSSANLSQTAVETLNSFTSKWEFDVDSYREDTLTHYHNWYFQRYGFNDAEDLRKFLGKSRYILDVATAHGRDARLYRDNSSAFVIGVDFSPAVNRAKQELKVDSDRLDFLRADMHAMPLPFDFFDLVACDQALHHTPNTRSGFFACLKHVKLGGYFFGYVYRKKSRVREVLDDYFRSQLVSGDTNYVMKVSEEFAILGKAFTELQANIEITKDLSFFEIPAGVYNVQRLLYYYFFKCYYNPHISWNNNTLTNFDWYHPKDAHRHTVAEVEGWISDGNCEPLRVHECESGITFICRRLK